MTLSPPISTHLDHLPLRLVAKDLRLGVVLSAGFFGFYAHGGFLKALSAQGMVPVAFGGSSAGALVAAWGASGLPQDRLEQTFRELRKEDFWDLSVRATWRDLWHGEKWMGLLRGEKFQRLLGEYFGERDVSSMPLLISTFDVDAAEPCHHRRGPVSTLVRASCAYPGLFGTVRWDGHRHWDGGIVDKAPAVALCNAFEVDAVLIHYLESASSGATSGFLRSLDRGFSSVRTLYAESQFRELEARGIPVYVLRTGPSGLGPSNLADGPNVLLSTAKRVEEALSRSSGQLRTFRTR